MPLGQDLGTSNANAAQAGANMVNDAFMCPLLPYGAFSAPSFKLIDFGGIGEDASNTKKASEIEGVDFSRFVGSNRTRDYKRALNAEAGSPDLVFVTSRMTSSAHTSKLVGVGRASLQAKALTLAIVIRPPQSEGEQALEPMLADFKRLSEAVDTLVIVPESRLQKLGGRDLDLSNTSANNSDLILYAVRCVSDILTIPGLMGLDFNDVRSVLKEQGTARMGIGISSGENRAETVAREAITSPLLEDICIREATGAIVNITGGPDAAIHEVNEACALIEEAVSEDADIVFGNNVDPKIGASIRVTVLFCGLGEA